MRRLRVLLVDDQALFREGLRTLLSVHDEIEVIGEAAEGREALERIAVRAPDVVLMDLRMPGVGGVEATRRIREAHPAVRVLVLTTFDEDELLFDALRAGASGYLLKDCNAAQLAEAVRAAARGQSYLHPTVAAKVVAELNRIRPAGAAPNRSLADPLSERELEVLRELSRGRSNREIAEQLHLAEGTVKNHVSMVLAKLGVRDRTRAALKARELGLVRNPSGGSC
jgi:DNA-binding NarL/FixJ family response regulator